MPNYHGEIVEAVEAISGAMVRDGQPQRALHNALNMLVEEACVEVIYDGVKLKNEPADVVSWIRQFCDTYEVVAVGESGVAG